MIYPKFIKKDDTIAITAPSDGIYKDGKLKQLDFAKENIKKYLNANIIETANVRNSLKGRSSSSIERARQLEELYSNNNVKSIICARGGDFLYEVLDDIDWNIIKDNPKWIQGYSDPTGLLYVITTKYDIATLYANNITGFGMKNLHKSLINNLEILKGNIVDQESFEKFQSQYIEIVKGNEEYTLDKDVEWINAFDTKDISFNGRLIGGCLEVIDLIIGTKHDATKQFIEKYKDDGIVWYIDVFDYTMEELIVKLVKMKNEGYFKYTKGFIFGRMINEVSYCERTFKETIEDALGSLNVPIIVNADIGHVSPRMTMINGAIVEVESCNKKGKISFKLI